MLMHRCSSLCVIAGALVIIGALNWGLVGVANFNLVDYIFGMGSIVSRIIYSLVGLSGLSLLISYFTCCPSCNKPEDKKPEDM